jgi:hypothetical protein
LNAFELPTINKRKDTIMKLQYAPADTLSRLVDDIRLAETGSLSSIDFDGAPTLYAYRTIPHSVGVLSGIVEGHPKLRCGREISTSQVFFIDTEQGVARTLSRWYRLDVSAVRRDR